jgi:hypothetical protein
MPKNAGQINDQSSPQVAKIKNKFDDNNKKIRAEAIKGV